MARINTALISQNDGSASFESKITHYLMRNCYEKLIAGLGKEKAEVRMNEAWKSIEQVMLECNMTEPVTAAGILFERSNYNQQLHSLNYATIFWMSANRENSDET